MLSDFLGFSAERSLGALRGEGRGDGGGGLRRERARHGSAVGVHRELLRAQDDGQHLGVAHHHVPRPAHIIPAPRAEQDLSGWGVGSQQGG